MSRIVLVAEDETLSQRLVTAVIQYCGLTPRIVSNGQEALDALNEGLAPELILLDLEMPVMGGIEFLNRLKDIPPELRCPIVVFTANNQQSTVKEALALGADDFVVKPFKTNELAQRIKDLVFEISETELQHLLHNLHVRDMRLHEVPSLAQRVGNHHDLYPFSSQDKRMAIAVPHNSSPQNLARLPYADLSNQLAIYRKCAFGWRKVWPRSAKMVKATAAAS
jgi:CheY-like chemotaxis protein